MGDLSENAEYHSAKQRQEFVNAHLGQLKKRMAELSLVNLANIPHDRVGFGSTIVVFDQTKDEEITYKLVTSEESDVTIGLISTTSPIGRSLVGKQVGDEVTVVTPNGKRILEDSEVEPPFTTLLHRTQRGLVTRCRRSSITGMAASASRIKRQRQRK